MTEQPFELKTSWGEAIRCIAIGTCLIIVTIGGLLWLLWPLFTIKNSWDGISASTLLIVIGIVGLPFLVYLVGMFSFMLIGFGVSYRVRLKKYDGLIYKLDEHGLTYFENNQYNFKKWSEISDVGCFKQEDKNIKIFYKYQVKFTDGTSHEFDLRGKYPTEKFKERIESYWLFYNE